MAKKLPRVGDAFVEQRTRSLATIYLTRRDDLLVTEGTGEDAAVDLEVAIKPRKVGAQRKFGVLLKGTKNHLTADQANALVKPTLEALGARAYPYPVCLFFFQMVNDRGLFTWVAAPVVTARGHPVLEQRSTPTCQALDTAAVNDIVDAVSAWYDAFYEHVAENGRGRQRKNGIEVLHGIIDREAGFISEYGKSPRLLKLPILQAYEMAKLGREHLGELAGQIIKEGVRVLEKDGLLGMKVKLVTDQEDISLE